MNKNISYYLQWLPIWLFFTALLVSCHHTNAPVQKQALANNSAYYTCSMHPQVHEDHPGNCPICGMKLLKVELTGSSGTRVNRITLTASQIQLGGIVADTVRDENTGADKTVTGTVAVDENGASELSARLPGRIQHLFIRTVGEQVTKGQAVYSLYSEDLEESEKEFLLAREQKQKLHNPDVDYNALINTAENKLKLWGLTTAQINVLAESGKISAATTIYSSINGTVSAIGVHEGDYVTEGMTILRTADLAKLWVEAQLYTDEAGGYKPHDLVSVSFPDLNGLVIGGRVDFINPELSEGSKINLVRISIPNKSAQIRPGMQAYISVANGSRSPAVPSSAVITDGKGSRVWVKNNDGTFSPREVEVGKTNNDYSQIISGLTNGEVVVTSGAYLLNSEDIFRNGNDQDNMAGMKM